MKLLIIIFYGSVLKFNKITTIFINLIHFLKSTSSLLLPVESITLLFLDDRNVLLDCCLLISTVLFKSVLDNRLILLKESKCDLLS